MGSIARKVGRSISFGHRVLRKSDPGIARGDLVLRLLASAGGLRADHFWNLDVLFGRWWRWISGVGKFRSISSAFGMGHGRRYDLHRFGLFHRLFLRSIGRGNNVSRVLLPIDQRRKSPYWSLRQHGDCSDDQRIHFRSDSSTGSFLYSFFVCARNGFFLCTRMAWNAMDAYFHARFAQRDYHLRPRFCRFGLIPSTY